MKSKCYSVQLQSIEKISEKAYKATGQDGTQEYIPASQFYGPDIEGVNAYFITAWILEKKKLPYTTTKERWFDEDGNMLPVYDKKNGSQGSEKANRPTIAEPKTINQVAPDPEQIIGSGEQDLPF